MVVCPKCFKEFKSLRKDGKYPKHRIPKECSWQRWTNDYCPRSKTYPATPTTAGEKMIGRVYADNTEDKSSLDSIKCGSMAGEGLLGEALVAVLELARVEHEAGYFNDDDKTGVDEANVKLFNALKAIEDMYKSITNRTIS